MTMEEFKRSNAEEMQSEEDIEVGSAFYAADKRGAVYFAKTKEEAAQKARQANEGYN